LAVSFWTASAQAAVAPVVVDAKGRLYQALPHSVSAEGVKNADNTIYRMDLSQGNLQRVLRLEPNSFNPIVALSPSQRYLAVLYHHILVQDEMGKNKLVIVEIETGKIRTAAEDVCVICWHPREDKIAYIRGEEFEGGIGYRGRAVEIIELAPNARKKVPLGDLGPMEIYWAPHDGRLYVSDFSSVVRYDPEKNAVEKTSYHGIFFSPDGKYYCSQGYEGEPAVIYRTAENQSAEDINTALTRLDPYLTFLAWVPARNEAWFQLQVRGVVRFDLRTGAVTGNAGGFAIGADRSWSKIVFHPYIEQANGSSHRDGSSLRIVELKRPSRKP
jgi:hypothetical protein